MHGSPAHRTARAIGPWLVIGVVSLALVACGSSSPSGSPSAPTSAPSVPAPSVPASAAASPSAASAAPSSGASGSPAASADIGPCSPSDIKVVATDAGGAAGSRGADVQITAIGAATCRLPSRPMVALLDATGQAVLQTPITVDADGPLVSGPSPVQFTYEFSNWCSPTVSTPWTVVLATAVGAVPVTGLTYQEADLPPCNGPGQPPSITASGWTTAGS